MPRYEFRGGGSAKFWEIVRRSQMEGQSVVTVRFGRIGTAGQMKSWNFKLSYEATDFYDKKIREKVSKGYELVGSRDSRIKLENILAGGVEISGESIETIDAEQLVERMESMVRSGKALEQPKRERRPLLVNPIPPRAYPVERLRPTESVTSAADGSVWRVGLRDDGVRPTPGAPVMTWEVIDADTGQTITFIRCDVHPRERLRTFDGRSLAELTFVYRGTEPPTQDMVDRFATKPGAQSKEKPKPKRRIRFDDQE